MRSALAHILIAIMLASCASSPQLEDGVDYLFSSKVGSDVVSANLENRTTRPLCISHYMWPVEFGHTGIVSGIPTLVGADGALHPYRKGWSAMGHQDRKLIVPAGKTAVSRMRLTDFADFESIRSPAILTIELHPQYCSQKYLLQGRFAPLSDD